MHSLNSTAATLLGLLHSGEASGYELLAFAEGTVGAFWTLTRSQVYRELTALANRGLITGGDAGPRARVRYHLSDEGREAFAHWIIQPPGTEQIRYPLLLSIIFGGHLDTQTLMRFVADHRTVHQERHDDYRTRLATAEGGPHLRATLAFGLRYEEAVLAWMDELPAILDASERTAEKAPAAAAGLPQGA
ncbi:PadR family transcriptional regulator [Streptomyces sp. NPDC060184]|uniref:PadR family transcriptional regulator n=1 Tax=Streptomyces sp. NPDC060184 TaxID=3347064 RepID=UPI0036673BFC